MNASIELIPLDEISADKAPAIYGANILDRYVEAARAEVSGEVPDLTTRKGRERIASLAAQVARSKTAVEKPGREYLKRIKELPKSIEAELREFVQAMDTLRDEVRAPLNEWQAAEDARIDRHQAVIDELNERGAEAGTYDADYLRSSIALVEQMAINESMEEFEAEAARAKDKTLASLRDALAVREKQEAEQAELERLRKEAAEREKKDREERIAREAAEAERLAAEFRAQSERDAATRRENEARAAAERRELELKLAAEQSARREQEAQQRAEQAERDAAARAEQAAQAERQRQADEQARIEAETKAREADKAHKTKVMGAAKEALMSMNITEELAKAIVLKIARREIPNVTINF